MKKLIILCLFLLRISGFAQSIQIVPNASGSMEAGQIFYDKTIDAVKFYNGTDWKILRGEPENRIATTTAAAFIQTIQNSGNGYENKGITVGLTSGTDWLQAPLYFEYNRPVVGIETVVYDASTVSDLKIQILTGAGFGYGGLTAFPDLNSSGSSGFQTLSVAVSPTFTPTNQSFFIIASPTTNWDNNLKFVGFRVKYQ